MNYPVEDFIIRFVARKETQEDVQKLKKWLAVAPARRYELKQWLVAWDMASMMDTIEKLNPDKAYKRFLFHPE